MTEFPGTDWRAGFKMPDVDAVAPLPADWRRLRERVEHVFTHFALRLTVYAGLVPASTPAPDGARFVSERTLASEALPSVMQKVRQVAAAEVAD
jgi:A/G-specific adenine glycosylase